ncbi:hypothetical protein MnTg02_00428 [bacterium MnTg02]|nr:hypothetical protein MnTg02_00428 [bacterium MnTg02]
MNTPTHLLISIALLAKPDAPRRNMAVIFGALIPDLSIYVLFVWAKLVAQVPEQEIWRHLYWQEPWQTLSGLSNSFPLYAMLVALGVWRGWTLLAIFGASALLHLAFDFPFHASDAHRHFWPFSDWRFHSPLSYWDGGHYGELVGIFELAMAIALMAIIFRRFKEVWVKVALAIGLVSYAAVPLYFMLAHHG